MTKTQSMQKPTFFRHHTDIKIGKESVSLPMAMTEYHYHDAYELYYLMEGERYYFIKNKSYLVKDGSFVLIDKYDIHSTASHQGSGYKRILISFNENTMASFYDPGKDAEILSCFKRGLPVIRLTPEDRSTAESILNLSLKEYASKKQGYEDFLRAGLLQLLMILSRYAHTEKNVSVDYINSSHKMISEIVAYINNHFSEEITLDFLSARFHISTHYLSRTFKKFTGISLIDYLNNIRVKEAQKLILAGTMSMQQICEAVGYNNYTHFGRVFKEISGITPLKYKKENK